MLLKIYKPEIFQGSLSNKDYFEGWYFKNVSKDLNHVFSFIPGISLAKNDPHSFIQIINGITGETAYVRYALDQFSWDKKYFKVNIRDSIFSEESIRLDIEDKNLQIKGIIKHINRIHYPKSLLSPGIMGWYSFVPFMECKHGVVSVKHDLEGMIEVNNMKIDFNQGTGYIEKDWGRSFPRSWIWLQCNTFLNSGTSLLISIAEIPWLGHYFTGLISFIYFEGKFFFFHTYNNSSIKEINNDDDLMHMVLSNRRNELIVDVKKNKYSELKAPVNGNMTRKIKESIDSEVHIKLLEKNKKVIYEDSGRRGGLEINGNIFDHIK